jgi:enoyl-CoA hydratase
MGILTHRARPGTAEVVLDVPPVNALDVAGWFALAEALLAAGRDP